ncbi:hypothetical protein D3C75_1025260 [compost metagenome]
MGGVLQTPWLPSAFSLKSRVKGKCDKALLGKTFRVESSTLLLYAGAGMADDDRRARAANLSFGDV